ncbi:MAG: hypothetical protein HY842_14245 [Bacteroidetes bacterium]|nr:hypothetical protein [Bacteroidota bacterium]
MNFLLKNLEFELDDRYLLVGEKLLDDGKVSRLFENERHLWVASVDGFEVEMQISPSKVRAFSCECPVFLKEEMCGHVAAGLLLLRRKLSETKPENPKTKHSRKQLFYQKLTVNSVLDNVEPDDLTAFVRSFARSNQPFSLALRARFASKVPMPDEREKFGQLLDAAISSARKANDRISAAGATQLKNMLRELMGQADDAVALEHFAESWAILSAAVERVSPILRKLDGDDARLREAVREAFSKLTNLASLPIPPALQEEIRAYCLAEFGRPAYRLNGFSGPLLEIYLSLSTDTDMHRQLLQTIDNELVKPNLNPQYRSPLLVVKLKLLKKNDLEAEAEAFTLDCLAAPENLMNVVDAAEEHGLLTQIKPLAEKGLRLIADPAVKKRLEEILLQIAQQEGESEVVTAISRQKFLETKDFGFYEKCKAHFRGDWADFVQQLLHDLVGQPNYRLNIHAIATILGMEAKPVELLALIEAQNSLDFLLIYDRFLLKTHPVAVLGLYEKLVKNYLTDHLGRKASQRLRSIFNHLRKNGAEALADRLFESVRASFPKRIFYLEEMEAPNF